MKQIVIILILFQLIGCTQQLPLSTCPEETLQEDKTNYMGISGWGVSILIVGVLAAVGIIIYQYNTPLARGRRLARRGRRQAQRQQANQQRLDAIALQNRQRRRQEEEQRRRQEEEQRRRQEEEQRKLSQQPTREAVPLDEPPDAPQKADPCGQIDYDGPALARERQRQEKLEKRQLKIAERERREAEKRARQEEEDRRFREEEYQRLCEEENRRWQLVEAERLRREEAEQHEREERLDREDTELLQAEQRQLEAEERRLKAAQLFVPGRRTEMEIVQLLSEAIIERGGLPILVLNACFQEMGSTIKEVVEGMLQATFPPHRQPIWAMALEMINDPLQNVHANVARSPDPRRALEQLETGSGNHLGELNEIQRCLNMRNVHADFLQLLYSGGHTNGFMYRQHVEFLALNMAEVGFYDIWRTQNGW